MKITIYCYHSVNGIAFGPSQSDSIKRFLYIWGRHFCFVSAPNCVKSMYFIVKRFIIRFVRTKNIFLWSFSPFCIEHKVTIIAFVKIRISSLVVVVVVVVVAVVICCYPWKESLCYDIIAFKVGFEVRSSVFSIYKTSFVCR